MSKEPQNLYEYKSYKDWLNVRLADQRGIKKRIADCLKVHTSLLSQILHGAKNLNEEQGLSLATFLGLNESETEYFLFLIRLERAGTISYRNYCKARLNEIRRVSLEPSERVKLAKELSPTNKAEFYSHWYFSAIRLLTSLDDSQTAEKISEKLQLPLKTVRQVLSFLVETGLCIEENGALKLGPGRTHEPSDSPHALRHHLNWRLKAIEMIPQPQQRHFAFTSPFTASEEDAIHFRTILSDAIASFSESVDSSHAEKLYCLNVDWFEV